MNLTELKNLASILGIPMPGFPPKRVMLPRPGKPAYGSASEARLAVCSRMSTPCLRRRVSRGRWSRTSHAAAVKVLMTRSPETVNG